MNLLNVNKTDLIEENPVLLNTLEQESNPIRAIFAVAKLNEGWDVLNLYDIVRIGEKASTSKSGTDSEAQLIGRGARYYTFNYEENKSYIRRFDTNNHELSILEQIHYHTINEASYIESLHNSLENADIIAHEDGNGIVYHAKVKEQFKKTKIYQQGKLYANKIEEITSDKRTWQSYSLETRFEESYTILNETSLDDLTSESRIDDYTIENLTIDKRYFYKAISRQRFYAFNNLQNYFPNLRSIDEFVTSNDYLGKIKISVKLPPNLKINDLTVKQKLQFLENVLIKIANNIRRNYKKYKGTYEFIGKSINEFVKDYSVYVDPAIIINQRITTEDTIGKPWFVYEKAILNQLEHKFVSLLESFIKNKFKEKYDDIYLIRNDEKTMQFKITEFNGMRGFMPDFILIMVSKTNNLCYQVFLEPKGDDRLLEDKWKEEMLASINDQDEIFFLNGENNIRLVGVRFYATSKRNEFIEDLSNKLYDGKPLEDNLLS